MKKTIQFLALLVAGSFLILNAQVADINLSGMNINLDHDYSYQACQTISTGTSDSMETALHSSGAVEMQAGASIHFKPGTHLSAGAGGADELHAHISDPGCAGKTHQVRIGFTFDQLPVNMASHQTNPDASEMDEFTRLLDSLRAYNFNNLAINQIYRYRWDADPATPVIDISSNINPNFNDPTRFWTLANPNRRTIEMTMNYLLAVENINLLIGLTHIPYQIPNAGYASSAINCNTPANCPDSTDALIGDCNELPAFYATLGNPINECDQICAYDFNSFLPQFTAPDDTTMKFGQAEYTAALQNDLISIIDTSGGDITFETGNEPESVGFVDFFWGGAKDYKKKADMMYQAIRNSSLPDAPLYYGALTGQTMSIVDAMDLDKDGLGKDHYKEMVNYDSVGTDNYFYSYHMFRQMGYGVHQVPGRALEKSWQSFNDHAHREGLDLQKGIISAYSLHVQTSFLNWKYGMIQSDYYMYELGDLYEYAYQHGVEQIFMWKLEHDPGDDSLLGFFEYDADSFRVMRSWTQLANMTRFITGGEYYTERDSAGRLFVYEADTSSPRYVFVSSVNWLQAEIANYIPATFGWTEVSHAQIHYLDDGPNDPSPGHPTWGVEDSSWLPNMQSSLLTEISSDSGYHQAQVYSWAIYEMTGSSSKSSNPEKPGGKLSQGEKLVVRPNPADDRVTVIVPVKFSTPYKIQMFDLAGKEVLDLKGLKNRRTIVDLSSFQDGIYIIEAIGTQKLRARVVVN